MFTGRDEYCGILKETQCSVRLNFVIKVEAVITSGILFIILVPVLNVLIFVVGTTGFLNDFERLYATMSTKTGVNNLCLPEAAMSRPSDFVARSRDSR